MGTKQRIENEVTDRARFQLRFCSQLSFSRSLCSLLVAPSLFPVLVTSPRRCREGLKKLQKFHQIIILGCLEKNISIFNVDKISYQCKILMVQSIHVVWNVLNLDSTLQLRASVRHWPILQTLTKNTKKHISLKDMEE